MTVSSPIDSLESESRFAVRLRDAFRRNGWRMEGNVRVADRCADMVVSKTGRRYLTQLKAASEGRRDRLVPLLAQAILEAQAVAKASSARICTGR